MFNITREKTIQEQAFDELQSIDFLSTSAFEKFKRETNLVYDLFWNGKVSPKVKIQVLGTKALEMFTASAKAQAFIKSIEQEYEEKGVPDNWQVNWNQDGSATLTEI